MKIPYPLYPHDEWLTPTLDEVRGVSYHQRNHQSMPQRVSCPLCLNTIRKDLLQKHMETKCPQNSRKIPRPRRSLDFNARRHSKNRKGQEYVPTSVLFHHAVGGGVNCRFCGRTAIPGEDLCYRCSAD